VNPPGAEAKPARHHLLVISDIHVGEYVKDVDRIGYIKGFSRQDESLCAFLEYHQTRWIDGVPWRLVINGDFIDFIAVTMRPGESAQQTRPGLSLSEDEGRWGLDSSEEKAVWKLDRIADRHRMLFTYLADFIGHGNRVDLLYGNHDVEFWWPKVHDCFREHLRSVYFGGEAVNGVSEQEFVDRVQFHPWFMYEPGRYYIEHGNQYDDFSSFEFRLSPLAPYDNKQLAMPVSHMAIRYFVNQYKGFRSHNKDNWTVRDYARWMRKQGLDNMREVFRLYIGFTSQMLTYANETRAADDEQLRAAHGATLEQVAARYKMPLESAQAIDKLRGEPITESFGRVFQTIGIDRQLLVLFWLLMAVVVFMIPFGWAWTLGLWAAVGALGALSYKFWPWVRERYLGGNVITHVAPKVDDAARRIAEIIDVRYVMFGHTHKPRVNRVRQNPPCWYLNSGSWLSPRGRERHGASDNCPSRLTFIVYRDGKVPDARLFRWCARDARPVAFDPRVTSQDLDPEQVELASALDSLEAEVGTPQRGEPRRRV
jgi:UDP-2,3-diacylglucosamine pyrophosphatase LpxH